MKKNRTNAGRLAGFTLDQTILVVAVIAILATVIISSVAWNVLNRANATKMTAHFTQIADAIGTYYRENDYIWPAEAADLAPYLAGYRIDGHRLITPFGTGSETSYLEMGAAGATSPTTATLGGGTYITFTMSSLQVQELIKANEAIDGPTEPASFAANTEGRLRWSAGTSDQSRVTATYYALKQNSL